MALVVEERERFLGWRIELASDEVAGPEQAEILSRASGREIRYVELPLEQVRSFSEDVALTSEWLDEVGYSVDVEALRRDYPRSTGTPSAGGRRAASGACSARSRHERAGADVAGACAPLRSPVHGVLDTAIVNLALPSIQTELGFSQEDLQ